MSGAPRRVPLGFFGEERALDRAGEGGETLIETLATLILLSLVIVTIVGMMWTMMMVTKDHRQATTSHMWVVKLGERLTDPLTTDYVHCNPSYEVSGVPAGFTAEIVGIEWLDDPAANAQSWNSTAPCGGASDDGGVQRLTIEAWPDEDDSRRERIQVIKRDTACIDETSGRLLC